MTDNTKRPSNYKLAVRPPKETGHLKAFEWEEREQQFSYSYLHTFKNIDTW